MKFAPKLAALFISISVIIIVVMFTIVYFQVAKILENEIKTRIGNRAISTMDALDCYLYGRLNDTRINANDPIISSGNATAEEITERLISFRNTYKSYVSLSFFNLERVRIADTSGLNIGAQDRMTRYWEDVLAGQVSAASDVHIAKDLQVPIVYFASVVNNKEGKVIGVVVARISTNQLFEMVKISMGIQKGEEIDIINKNGLLIYSNHNRAGILKDNLSNWKSVERALQGKLFGSARHQHPDQGQKNLQVFCREQGYLDFKGNGWIIIACVSTRVIFNPVNKLLNMLIF